MLNQNKTKAHNCTDAHILGIYEKDAYEIFKGKEVQLPATEIWLPNILKLVGERSAKNYHIRPKRRLSFVATKTVYLLS